LLNFEWRGGFPKKRNWVLLNHKFATDWVLFLDADEFLTDAFVEELQETISKSKNVGYWLSYRNHFEGRILRYGVPQRKLGLFKVGAGFYEKIDDLGWSELDMEVHEHPIVGGPVGEIGSPIDHLDYRGLHHFIARHNAYSSWEANRYLFLRRERTMHKHLSQRQIAKYRFVTSWWFPVAYFLFTYLIRGGFLDGRAGFVYASFKANYFLQIREKIAELIAAQDAS
jgi:hypothetical protein